MARGWNTGVEHTCGGMVEAFVSYLKPEKYVVYDYKCLKCGETGPWKELARRMGKIKIAPARKNFKKNSYSKKPR